jgi:alpha-N-arabinofuranosidase
MWVMQAVNFGNTTLNLSLAVSGISASSVIAGESYVMVMTSAGLMDENSFTNPVKVLVRFFFSWRQSSFLSK